MNGVNKTLYIPLYGKSKVSKQGIILKDTMAEKIWESESFKIKGKSKSKWLSYNMAMENDRVVGFIGLKKALVEPYMILDLMQVSAACRGQGIGRKLFDIGKEEARKAGAKGLYISACSSEETIAFYKAMGAELTDCPIKEIAEAEPCDLQMVCCV